MKEKTGRLRTWAIASACTLGIAIAAGAGAGELARQYFVQARPASEIFILPGGNPKFDSDIARLDTRTGAVYRFRGDVDNASVTNTWELRVPEVKGSHSGLLEIQQVVLPQRNTPQPDVEPTTFLVDQATGHTWILRQRASTNATWDPVKTFRH